MRWTGSWALKFINKIGRNRPDRIVNEFKKYSKNKAHVAIIDTACLSSLKEIIAQDSEQSDKCSASAYIAGPIDLIAINYACIACNIYKARSIFYIYCTYIIWNGLQSKHCVPFNSFVPCHCFWPFLPIECFVVLTELGRSDGSSLPRSKEEIRFEVDQNQVRFHVIDKCFFIQKASLNILVVEWTSNWRSCDNIPCEKIGIYSSIRKAKLQECCVSEVRQLAKQNAHEQLSMNLLGSPWQLFLQHIVRIA